MLQYSCCEKQEKNKLNGFQLRGDIMISRFKIKVSIYFFKYQLNCGFYKRNKKIQ